MSCAPVTSPTQMLRAIVAFTGIFGQIAQSVEQRIENPRVGGSIPSLATFFPFWRALCTGSALCVTLVGCGNPCGVVWNDQCEKLCCQVAKTLDECDSESWTWMDLGASNKDEFVRNCFQDWDDLNGDLTTYEAQQAIQVCDTTRESIEYESGDAQCDELLGIYLQSSL